MQLMYIKAFSHHSNSTTASHAIDNSSGKVLHKSLSYSGGNKVFEAQSAVVDGGDQHIDEGSESSANWNKHCIFCAPSYTPM